MKISRNYDENVRRAVCASVLYCSGAKVLENRITADEERIKLLEKELEMTIVFGEEADRKYEEVSRAKKLHLPLYHIRHSQKISTVTEKSM